MLRFRRRNHPDEDDISAFLDRELKMLPRSIELSAHFETCESCRATLEELRSVQALIAGLPNVAAPRSFALTPEMAGVTMREKPVRRASLAFAPAVALTVLVALLALDFGGGSGSRSNDQATSSLAVSSESGGTSADSELQAGSVEDGADGGLEETAALPSEAPAAADNDASDPKSGAIQEGGDGGLSEVPAAAADTEASRAATAPPVANGPTEDEAAANASTSDKVNGEEEEGLNWLRVFEVVAAMAFGASLLLVLVARRGMKGSGM